jgi:dCMP deaminase
MNQLYTPTWDEFYMRHAYLASTKSKDPHTKVGSVLIRDNTPISEGFNGLPRKVNDNVPERFERPEKYFWCEHGERNAIYNCARNGIKTLDSTLYCFALPCADCARGIIQCGVKEIVIHKQWDAVGINKKNEKWIESASRSRTMLIESGVNVREFDMVLNIQTLIDGRLELV